MVYGIVGCVVFVLGAYGLYRLFAHDSAGPDTAAGSTVIVPPQPPKDPNIKPQ